MPSCVCVVRDMGLQELGLRGRALLVVSAGALSNACLWNSLRVLRLARNMHVQVSAHLARVHAPFGAVRISMACLYQPGESQACFASVLGRWGCYSSA